jgi:hypothetical protein
MSLTAQAWRAAKMTRQGFNIAAHNAMAKLLRCDPAEGYALMPFAPVEIDGTWFIAAAPEDRDTDELLLIDGKTGAMRYADDAAAVGFWGDANIYGARLHVYSNGIVFAREWVVRRREALDRAKRLGTDVVQGSHSPGLAMIGAPDKIGNFADLSHAGTIEIDNPRLRHVLADAMLKSARLPVVVAPQPKLKAVG